MYKLHIKTKLACCRIYLLYHSLSCREKIQTCFVFFPPVPLTEETPSSFPVSFELIVAAQTIKNPPAMKETQVQSESGRFPREGTGYPLQYSCLENPMDRGAWQATVHGVTNSQTELRD